jgi:hypothetical protein
MFWTEVSCWRKRYSDKTTLFLRWSHCFKNYMVVITNWSIVTKYPILKWLYVDFVFTLSPTRLLQDLTGVIIGVETAYRLAIVLSVLLLYTDSDYPFGIFELFFSPVAHSWMPLRFSLTFICVGWYFTNMWILWWGGVGP